jgi:glutamyl-tRNA reductase
MSSRARMSERATVSDGRVMPDRLWNRLALRAVTPQTGSMRLRERVSIRADALGPLLRLLRASARASEWLVLATCARIEIYAVSCEGGSASIDEVIAATILPVRDDEVSVPEWPICASGVDAARHLLRVASGVESIVLGDVQLLGQLRTAYATAQAQKTTGPLFNRLCQAALHAGKRARAETGIASGAVSMAAAAVRFATAHAGGMARRRVLIVGGGRMGRAIAAALSRQGCERITVATRDPDAFATAGGTRHACAVRSDAIAPALSEADVVFSASGTGKQLITTQTIVRARADRTTRSLLILDLAMPSEVDRGVADIPGLRLVTLDVLERSIERVAQSRCEAISAVERIVEETLDRLFAWSSRVNQAA